MSIHRILWIEDNPYGLFGSYLTPILMDPYLVLDHARDATQAYEMLQKASYELIVFDLDLPPGEHEDIRDIYNRCTPKAGQRQCILGVHLLAIWLGHTPKDLAPDIDIEKIRLHPPLGPEKVLVYSVYANEHNEDLAALNLTEGRIIQKDASQTDTFLHQAIKAILEGKDDH